MVNGKWFTPWVGTSSAGVVDGGGKLKGKREEDSALAEGEKRAKDFSPVRGMGMMGNMCRARARRFPRERTWDEACLARTIGACKAR